MDTVNRRATVRSVPPELAAKLRAMNDLNDEFLVATRKLYLPALKARDRTGITVERDAAYGPDERQRLDVHMPEPRPRSPVPVVLFFHGGGYTRGHKNEEGEHLHGNVADFFARNGMIGINATYRLAPAHQWPAGAEDVGAAVSWTRQNVARYGGDPGRLYAFGHSAAAAHVAAYALHKDLDAAPRAGLAGIVLASGGYALDSEAPHVRAYYGDDVSRHAARATPGHVTWGDFDIFITTAEHEPFRFARSVSLLVEELTAKGGRMPRLKYLLDHNHYSPILSFGTGDPSLADEVLDFVLSSSSKASKAA